MDSEGLLWFADLEFTSREVGPKGFAETLHIVAAICLPEAIIYDVEAFIVAVEHPKRVVVREG
jgi:hypothetical protein